MYQYPVLFLTGLAAGFVDSIAGGGGLITIPVLLNLGLAPNDALGTNKLQATFGSSSAAWHYAQARLVTLRDCWLGAGLTFGGAVAGTLVVQQLHAGRLRQLIPWLLLGIAGFMLVRPTLGEKDAHPRLTSRAFHLLFGLGIGFYDGFFGPGTGTFWAMAYVTVLGYNLTKATAHTKVMNFSSNAASLLFFAVGGHVQLLPGLVMGAGQFLGAQWGARTVVRRGTRFIRPVFITVVLALTAKLLWDNGAK